MATPFTSLNWDSETHLFFADHYRQDWFEPWDRRWYEGFFVFSYPPLSHQLVAAFSYPFGLEIGYKIVQAIALGALPVSMWLFVRENFGKAYANHAAMLSTMVPSVYLMLYAFGQLPSFIGMVLCLASLGLFGRFVNTGQISALIGWSCLAGAAAATHHHTVLIIMPGLVSLLVLQQWISPQAERREILIREMFALFTVAYTVFFAILPFAWWSEHFYQAQAEIPHPTRNDIFSNDLYAELFFWDIYGSLLIAVPVSIVVLVVRREWNVLPMMAAVVTLAVLGLGTNTPLPKIVFRAGGFWEWLTYERFAIWASVLSVIPLSVWFGKSRDNDIVKAIMACTIIVLLGYSARAATISQSTELVPEPLEEWEEQEIVKFLEDDNHIQWNYITLGLGEAQLARISRQTRAQTIDGTYYTVRRREELRESGIPSIDSSIWQENTTGTLLSILSNPEDWNLRWAILGKPEFSYVLEEAGWERVHPLGSDASYSAGDPVFSTVWIWQVPDSRDIALAPEQPVPPYPPLAPLMWGILPLFYLTAGIAAAIWSLRR